MRDQDLQSRICFRHDTDVTAADADLSVGLDKAEDGDVTFSMECTALKAGSGTADAPTGSSPYAAVSQPSAHQHLGTTGVRAGRGRSRAGALAADLAA